MLPESCMEKCAECSGATRANNHTVVQCVQTMRNPGTGIERLADIVYSALTEAKRSSCEDAVRWASHCALGLLLLGSSGGMCRGWQHVTASPLCNVRGARVVVVVHKHTCRKNTAKCEISTKSFKYTWNTQFNPNSLRCETLQFKTCFFLKQKTEQRGNLKVLFVCFNRSHKHHEKLECKWFEL